MSRAYFRKVAEFPRQYTRLPKSPRLLGALCDRCPLNGSTPVWGDGSTVRDLAIVGEAPGREEVNAGLPFIGRSGTYVENLLARHGLTRADVWIDNALLCFPEGGDLKAFLQRSRKAAKDEGREVLSPVECCRPRLFFMLGIPRCRTCGLWDGVPEALQCRCPKGTRALVKPQGFTRPKAVLALGNSALESLTGHGGIKAKQLYRFGGSE
jgi:uracil-DNA glycosylase